MYWLSPSLLSLGPPQVSTGPILLLLLLLQYKNSNTGNTEQNCEIRNDDTSLHNLLVVCRTSPLLRDGDLFLWSHTFIHKRRIHSLFDLCTNGGRDKLADDKVTQCGYCESENPGKCVDLVKKKTNQPESRR